MKIRSWFAVALTALSGFGCGGGGGVSNGVNNTTAVAVTGVNSIYPKSADGTVQTLAGAVAMEKLQIVTDAGMDASAISLSVDSSQGATVEQSGGGWVLRVFGGITAGTRKIDIKATNNGNGSSKTFQVTVATFAAQSTTTGSLTASGGILTTSKGGQLKFLGSNNLSSPVDVKVEETTLGNGRTLLNITFGRDISASNVRLYLPRLTPVLVTSNLANVIKSPTTVGFTKSLDLATAPDPYSSDSKSLGSEWWYAEAYFLGTTRLNNDLSGIALADLHDYATSTNLANMLTTSQLAQEVTAIRWGFQIYLDKAASMTSSVPYGSIDSGGIEPVLFVHGFSANVTIGSGADALGGGQGTWQKFPKLAKQAGFLPFEFRWNTDARFIDVAADLESVIETIFQQTGQKKIHIIAHSFGGVLSRTYLQKLASNSYLSAPVNAGDRIASLTTLGSPHSGIRDAEGLVGSPAIWLPIGQDAWTFNVCVELSCQMMGEQVSYPASAQRIFGVSASPGEHAALLASSIDQIPSIPIFVGIGLRTTYDLLSRKVYGPGDALISYRGQRFLPSDKESALRSSAFVSNANVTEVILGTQGNVLPGQLLTSADVNKTDRSGGYLHSGSTGAVIQFATPNGTLGIIPVASLSDGIAGLITPGTFGIEAAPELACDAVNTCQHAGFLLFLKAACMAPKQIVSGSCVLLTPAVSSVAAMIGSPTLGQAITFQVVGTNLPLTIKMSIGGVDCQSPLGATSLGFTASCTPGGTAGLQQVIITDTSTGSVIDSSKQVNVSASAGTTSSILNPANGHLYEVITCGTWTQCDAAARAKGGNLVTIRNAAENAWIVANLLPSATSVWGLWIGYTDKVQYDDWRWSSGETSTYTNWDTSWLNTGVNTETVAHIVKQWGGLWNDTYDTNIPDQAIVEYAQSGTISVAANNASGTLFTVPIGANSCTFNASGTWSNIPTGSLADASGYAGAYSPGFVVPSAPSGALVALGSTLNIGIGVQSTLSVTPLQVMRFVINDYPDGYSDNSGSLSVAYQCQ